MNNYLYKPIEAGTETGPSAFGKIYRIDRKSRAKRWLFGTLFVLLVFMFLPWTQNIRARGSVTTLRQEQRPQQINTVIAGSVSKWYVKEGDFVKAGDTILQLGEVKAEYFDRNLLQRTQEQITAKQQSIDGYRNKANASEAQMEALREARKFKLETLDNKITQQQLKIKTEEAELLAVKNELDAYQRQIDAAKVLLDNGAISLTEFERRKINFQNSTAKLNSATNKLEQSRQELVNLGIEKQSAIQEYTDKIAKAQGEGFSSLSEAATAEAEVAKLQNAYANYDVRNKLYYILAPQSGQVSKAKKAGIGEFLKEGEMIAEIVPDKVQFAIELFVSPMDLPLISIGQKVRFIFDGFPVIVFSGWPGGSYGTFGGRIIAIEKSVSVNGKFRVLVTEDPSDRKWPEQLSIGGGAEGIALLKDVRIYYEIWRRINGFPPEYYQAQAAPVQK